MTIGKITRRAGFSAGLPAIGKAIYLICLSGLPVLAEAASGYLQYGGANTGSFATRSLGLGALTGNPAAGQYLLKPEQSFRAGVISLPHVGYEFGPVDNFMDDIDKLEKELDRDNLTQAEAQAIIDQFNTLLVAIGDAAYVNIDVQQQVPITPMIFRAFGGVMTVDAAAEARASVRILDAPLTLVDNGDGTYDATTDSAAYIRSGVFTRLSFGYSGTLPPFARLPLPDGARLIAGGRLSVIQGKLSKQVAKLDSGTEESAFDRVGDNYDANQKSATAVGLDVGTMFTHGSLSAGFTVYNLLPPKFEFGTIGVDCASIVDPGQRSDCQTAASFASEIDLAETYSEQARLNAEASYRILGSNWVTGGALDLNKVDTVAGSDFQWLAISAGYESPNWWLPGFAIAYKKNLAGSKLSYATLGFALFSALNINLSYGLESAKNDGKSVPRSAAVGISFEAPL